MARPIGVVGDVIPLIGSILGAGAGLAALLLTVIMAPVVTAIAWFAYRPLVAVATLAAGLVLAFLFFRLVRGRRRQRPARFLPA